MGRRRALAWHPLASVFASHKWGRRDLTIDSASLPLCWECPKDLGLPLVLGGTQFKTEARYLEVLGSYESSKKRREALNMVLTHDFKISLTND